MRRNLMLPLANALSDLLPGIGLYGLAIEGSQRTYAAWRVWNDSTTAKVRFASVPKKQAVRLYHKARQFERQTRLPGRQDGALGRNGLAALHALLFDFLNYATGRLDPSYEAIARKACISVRSVAQALLEEAPDRAAVLDIFLARFRPAGWSGSLAAILDSRAALLLRLGGHHDRHLAEHAARAHEKLQLQIAAERQRETQEHRRRDERFE